MNGREIIKETLFLNLPLRQFTVVGSGALAIRGIRDAADIDLLVTQKLYDGLKGSGWTEEHHPNSKREWVVAHGPFDASTQWAVGDYNPTPKN